MVTFNIIGTEPSVSVVFGSAKLASDELALGGLAKIISQIIHPQKKGEN